MSATPAGRALVALVVCLAVWLLLDAPSLERAAEASTLGTRRQVALALLRPLARVSAALGLDRPAALLDAAVGRTRRRNTPPRATRPAPGSLPPAPTSPVAIAAQSVRQPTAEDPLRVLVVGDSIAGGFGTGLARVLGATGVARVTVDGRAATGLARPDYFDWAAELADDVARYSPDVVVTMFGGNDAQSFLDHGSAVSFGSPAWLTAYRQRVDAIIAAAIDAGPAQLVWVGMPVMAPAGLSARMRVLDRLYAEEVANIEVAKVGRALFVDSWPLFTDSRGGYSAYLPDAAGRLELMRQTDGVHLSTAGADRLADAVVRAMGATWGLALR